MAIYFTQYLRPHGTPKPVAIDGIAERIEGLAAQIRAAGYHFDAEVLTTGHVSFTVEKDHPKTDEDDQPIAVEICDNGPAVLPAITRLMQSAAERLRIEWPSSDSTANTSS